MLVFERVLVPVARFPALAENVGLAELQDAWQGHHAAGPFRNLYPSETSLADLIALLGQPGPSVHPRPQAQVVEAVWADPHGLGIVPFEALSPRMRALRVDGLSAIDNQLPTSRWPLARRVWLASRTTRGLAALRDLRGSVPSSNRDLGHLTVVTTTGVTAMTRGTAEAMERRSDFAWPARIVGPDLAASDLTTTSNEVSFLKGCIADNRAGVGHFCARPEYFAALELSGIDLVGLTGNHLNDFGTAPLLSTLEFYQEKGIRTYGGGRDILEARAPLIVEHHGNSLAFLGANQFGPPRLRARDGQEVSAWAGPESPGSAPYDPQALAAAVRDARLRADVVFAELQYQETNAQGEYQVEPVSGQEDAFRALAEAGADAVIGAQAHAPQSIEFRAQSIILYGLGNLYFDQTWSWPTRTGLVARHAIYDHHLISTELLVTVIRDDMQLRWATPDERTDVLETIFAASGW